MVTPALAGACLLDATQAGDHRYAAAPSVRAFMRVNTLAQTMSFPALPDRTYGDPVSRITVVGGRSSHEVVLTSQTPDVCSVILPTALRVDGVAMVSAYVNPLKAGRCELSAAQDGDLRYGRTDGHGGFDIARATQTLQFPALTSRRYGDPAFEVAVVGGPSTARVVLTSRSPAVCTVSGTTVKPVGVGRCALQAMQDGDARYAPAQPVQADFLVTRALQTLDVSASSGLTYGGPAFPVTVLGGGSGEPIAVTSATPGVCSVTTPLVGLTSGVTFAKASVRILAAGQCRVRATQGGNGLYAAAAAVERGYAIGRAPLVVTSRDVSMVIGGPVPPLDVKLDGLVNGDPRTVVSGLVCQATTRTGTVNRTTPIGRYPIRCSGGSAANYTLSYVRGTLTVGYAFTNPVGGLFGATVTRVKAGSRVMFSWIIRDANGRPITDNTSFRSLVAAPMTCGGTPSQAGGTLLAAVPSAVAYDARSGTWSVGWKTAKGARGCVAVFVNLADGQSQVARLQFR